MEKKSHISYEESVFQLAKNGNINAQSQLVEQHQLMVRSFAASLCGNLSVADELAQDVFLRTLSRLDRIESAEQVAPFLKGVTRNVVREHFKKQKHQESHQQRWMEICEDIWQQHDISHRSDDADDLERLSICLSKLPEKSRELLEQRYAQGMNASEISESHQFTAAAVRKSISRIRQKLLSCMQKQPVSPL